MRGKVVWAALLCAASTSGALAQSAKIVEGKPPSWALAPPESSAGDPPKDALIQVRFFDTQVRLSKKGQENYISQRFKILQPEALQAANLRFMWRPATGQLAVHSIRVHRKDGSSSEMLGKSAFQTIQREENLEQAVITGVSTTIFAIPGVDIGDEVEFSATISDRDPTLAGHAFGSLQLPTTETAGAFRARLLRSDNLPLNRKLSTDLDKTTAVRVDQADELVVDMVHPKSMNFPEGAPARYTLGRFVEYSSFTGWPQISSTFWKLFERSSTLTKDSPLRVEVSKIAAASSDPETRALAALKLVQDRVRYVFVGFGTGNYTPASADETWERRYGDCKGKSALLLALLRGLGLNAEAALVNQSGLTGINSRLPSPGLFDHVLVRVAIGDKSYWLDGTQFSSPKLIHLPQPSFHAALPLRSVGAELEDVPAIPLKMPQQLDVMEIDASAGVGKPARIKLRRVVHGNEVSFLRSALAALSGDDLKRGIRQALAYRGGDTEAESTNWAYDEVTGALSLTWEGTQELDWESETPCASFLYVSGGGFTPPDEKKRPKEQDQAAPWAVDFPSFKCWITTIQLPPDQGRVRWTYSSKPINRALGGIQYFRQATLQKGKVQTVMSTRALQAELTADEAKAIKIGLPTFDNQKSWIYQTRVGPDAENIDDPRAVVDPAAISWNAAGKICQPPTKP